MFVVDFIFWLIINQNSLYQLATNKIDVMFASGYLGHDNNDGCDFGCRAEKVGITNTPAGESLLRYKKDSISLSQIVKAWQNSPAHNEVLNNKATKGILIFEQRNGEIYAIYNYIRQ